MNVEIVAPEIVAVRLGAIGTLVFVPGVITHVAHRAPRYGAPAMFAGLWVISHRPRDLVRAMSASGVLYVALAVWCVAAVVGTAWLVTGRASDGGRRRRVVDVVGAVAFGVFGVGLAAFAVAVMVAW